MHVPCILQLALLMFKAPSRTFATAAALGTETAALGAAKATVLESTRMKASEEIVSPHISILICRAAEAGSGLAQRWKLISEDQDTCLYTLKASVNFHSRTSKT